ACRQARHRRTGSFRAPGGVFILAWGPESGVARARAVRLCDSPALQAGRNQFRGNGSGVMDKLLQPLFELPSLTVYILIAVLCWTEAAFFLGFVTPGELAVVVGGILASRGQLEMDTLLGIVLVATVLGNATGFYLGRRWGEALLGWAPLQRFFGPSIRKAQSFMARRGEWAIVLGRVSTPTRIIVPFLAGASGVPYRRFRLFAIPASLVWAVVWAVLGFVLGESWGVLREISGTAALLVLILFLTALAIRWAAVLVARHQRRVKATF